MNFGSKSNKHLFWKIGLSGILLASLLLFWTAFGTVWTGLDYQILDRIYRSAFRARQTAQVSDEIVYLSIDDKSYQDFAQNSLDRAYLAEINAVLTELGARTVAYDIIFAYPSEPAADREFADSISELGVVYLPLGFAPSAHQRHFAWEQGKAYERLKNDYLKAPIEKGRSKALFATRALPQLDLFSEAAYSAGHITTLPDPDGVYRQQIMLLKIDDAYLPTLSLAMFLDDLEMPLEQLKVHWGREIRIPADQSPYLDEDVVIPIDSQGRTFIPYLTTWGHDLDFRHMSTHDLLEHCQNVTLHGNLESFFSGKFVFIGDIAHGADVGQTPLEAHAPLISTHAALLNALLQNHFYVRWSFGQVLGLLCFLAIVLLLAALPQSSWTLYISGFLCFSILLVAAYLQFRFFILFPLASTGGSFLFLFLGLVAGVEIRKRAFLLGAFSRYVPKDVVKELIRHPEKLALGGEKREMSVLFSDIQGFTTISETLSPEKLVDLLNEYLTEMTTIILAEGGIIDKYEGDAVMAEFGAPLPLPDHADRAVSAALKMQKRLNTLRQHWRERGLPELTCRIGIHSGDVVVGNMGSNQVFDYTVIGDDVNLASRLEGANKHYRTSLMISEATCASLTPDRFRARVLDIITVKGKSQPVKVFEVYGEISEQIPLKILEYSQTYQAAFEAYLARDFTRALTLLAAALELRSDDPASKWLISRIVDLDQDRLPDDWDGSVTLTSK